MKIDRDFRESWGGIAGVQSTLGVLLDLGAHVRGLPLERIASLVADVPARRFRIPRKGAIDAGYDADMVLVDYGASRTLTADQLLQRHRSSPYVGRTFRGVITRTIRRGRTIFADGRIVATGGGRMIRPALGRGVSWRM
jgi:allantoinase